MSAPSPPRCRWRAALLLALLALGCPAPEEGPLETGTKLYSQHDEELVIRDFFDDRRGGFFVDVGSFHWRDHSTTLYLEERLGWSGIAIDGNDKVRVGYEKNRPRTRFFNYIVTDHSGSLETLHLAGAVSSVSKEHVDRLRRNKERDDSVQVPAITLNDLLDREGVEEIDFLSMDIEGHEPEALAGFDIERFAPELVCIEAGANREKLLAWFEGHGYERIDRYLAHDSVNWYFRPRGR